MWQSRAVGWSHLELEIPRAKSKERRAQIKGVFGGRFWPRLLHLRVSNERLNDLLEDDLLIFRRQGRPYLTQIPHSEHSGLDWCFIQCRQKLGNLRLLNMKHDKTLYCFRLRACHACPMDCNLLLQPCQIIVDCNPVCGSYFTAEDKGWLLSPIPRPHPLYSRQEGELMTRATSTQLLDS